MTINKALFNIAIAFLLCGALATADVALYEDGVEVEIPPGYQIELVRVERMYTQAQCDAMKPNPLVFGASNSPVPEWPVDDVSDDTRKCFTQQSVYLGLGTPWQKCLIQQDWLD